MIGKHLVELFQAIGIERFYSFAYPLVDFLPAFEKEAVVRHFLREGMPEDIFELRKQALLVDEFQALEVQEIALEVFLRLCRIRKANSRPITEATCMILLRLSSNRSMRAAMIPWTVSGT